MAALVIFAALNSSLLIFLSDMLNNRLAYGSAGYTKSDIKVLSDAGLNMSDIENIIRIRHLESVSESDVLPEEESSEENEEDRVVIPGKHYDIKETYYDLTEYVNDTNRENTEVLEEYGQGGVLKSTHVYGNKRISTNVSATSDSIITEATGIPTVRNEMSANDFNVSSNAYDMSYLYDGRGSVAQTISDNVVIGSFNYDPFGSTTTEVSQSDNYYGYNGEETNSVTGLQYLRARYYDSDAGRFFNADTYLGNIIDPLSMNRYAYTQNNPVNYTDPSGHVPASMFSVLGKLNAPTVKKQGYNAFNKGYQYTTATKSTPARQTRKTTSNYSPKNSNFRTYIQPKAQFVRTYAAQKQAYYKDYMSSTRLKIINDSRKVSFEEKIKKANCERYKTYIKASSNQFKAQKQREEESKPWYQKLGEGVVNVGKAIVNGFVTAGKAVVNFFAGIDWGKVGQLFAIIGSGAVFAGSVISAILSAGATSPLVVMAGGVLVAAIAAFTASESQEVITDGESNFLKSALGEDLYNDALIFTEIGSMAFVEYGSSRAASGKKKFNNNSKNATKKSWKSQLDSMGENNISHKINGSKNSLHNWESVVKDKNWNDIKKIISYAMNNGKESAYKSVFSKRVIYKGREVEVTYKYLPDGTIKISDAWVKGE